MNYLLDNEETERLTFRKIQHSDLNEWLEFFKDPASFKYWTADLKAPEVECENWYEKQFNRYETNRGGMNALIEKESGKLIGHAGLLVQVVDGITELEVAYSLSPKGRNKGYATEASRKCIDVAFQKGYSDSLISIISNTNEPSVKVANKNGMKADKQTIYNQNAVTIFRMNKVDWSPSKILE